MKEFKGKKRNIFTACSVCCPEHSLEQNYIQFSQNLSHKNLHLKIGYSVKLNT